MKFCIIAVLALCAYAQGAANLPNFEDGITAQGGPQELRLTVGSDVVTDGDQQLSESLTGLERTQGRNVVANAIINAMENFRQTIIYGNDNIPVLDPLVVDQIGPFEYTETGVRVQGTIRNLKMDGLRWFVIDHVTFNTLRLALGVKVTVPWLNLNGAYDASARILLVSHNAGGNFRVSINRLEATVDVRVGTNILGGGTLILRELKILLEISNINIQIQGMVGSSVLNNLINSFVQNAAQNLIKNELEAISEVLSRELFDTINEILSNFTLDDLLG